MEKGGLGQSDRSPGSHILTGDTTVTDCSERPPGGCENSPRGWDRYRPAVQAARGAEGGHSTREWARVRFSCGRPGHGVNRCSQVDTSTHSCRRDGRYWVVRSGGTGGWSAPGNEGWSGWPPGSLGTKVLLTPAGEMVE